MNPFSWFSERRREEQLRQAKHSLRIKRARMLESYLDVFDNFVSPEDEMEGWLFLDHDWGSAVTGRPQTLVPLTTARGVCRHLAATNGYARNIGRNLQNYVVGSGFTCNFVVPEQPIGDMQPESFTDLVPLAERHWNEFVRRSQWNDLMRDVVANTHRDGEQFLRFFAGPDGAVDVRLVDPADVASDDPSIPEGIITDEEDSQWVIGYVMRGEDVDAADVEHIKINTDRDVLRGWPTLWCIREKLVRAEKILRNIGKVTELQAAIAMVREQPSALDATEFGSFLDDSADKTKTDPQTSRTVRQQKILSGAIIDMNPGGKLHFPVASAALTQFVAALQSQLRGIAAAINFPEHMISADASNNNYASILMAAAPSTKEFEAQQAMFCERVRRIMARVRDTAIQYGVLPAEARFLEPTASGPQVESKDEVKTAQAREIEKRNDVLSVKTWSAKSGLDYDAEQANREEHKEKTMDDGAKLPLPEPDPGETNEPELNVGAKA